MPHDPWSSPRRQRWGNQRDMHPSGSPGNEAGQRYGPAAPPPAPARRRIWPMLVGIAVLLVATGGSVAYIIVSGTR